MSKRKDFEYQGEFKDKNKNSVEPQQQDQLNKDIDGPSDSNEVEPSTPSEESNNTPETEDDNESINEEDESNNESNDSRENTEPSQNEISQENIDGTDTIQPYQNEQESSLSKDAKPKEDQDDDINSNNQDEPINESSEDDNEKQDNEDTSDNEDSDNNLKQESENDESEGLAQKDDDKSDHSLSDKLTDSEGGIGQLASKASGTVDALKKAKKFKDFKNMSKDEAKSQLYLVAKGVVKDKVVAAVVAFIAPYIVPIVSIILAIIILVVIIAGAVTSSITPTGSNSKDKCTPTEQNSSSNAKLSKDAEKNAETIFKEVKSKVKGSTDKGVASLLGNIDKESAGTFSSKTIQGGNKYKESLAMDASIGGYAFGFSQWDSGRRVNLIKFAEKQDKKWDDMDVQIDFLLNHDSTDSELIKKLVKQDKNIKQTTEDIMTQWERAGDTASLSDRQASASKYYAKFSGKGSDDKGSNIEDATDAASDNSDAGENSDCNNDSSSKVDGEMGATAKANGKSGKIVERWKSKKEIPKKYQKYISVPDFKEKEFLKESMFASSDRLRGQCTELTWGYMNALWSGNQPTMGNGGDLHQSYKSAGAKTTSNPTVGYGFSSYPPYAGAGDSSSGHTGVVVGVLDDGKWIMANYNLNLEAPDRVLTYALVDGNPKKGGTTFFSGVGKPKFKSKEK